MTDAIKIVNPGDMLITNADGLDQIILFLNNNEVFTPFWCRIQHSLTILTLKCSKTTVALEKFHLIYRRAPPGSVNIKYTYLLAPNK